MIRDEAQALAVALRNGFADVNDAVRWADAAIATEQHPHWTICDVALSVAKHRGEVADVLEEMPGLPNHAAVMDLLFQLVQRKLQADASRAESIARWLYQMALADNIHDDDLLKVAWSAWDSLALVDARITGNRADVINGMRNALATATERAKARGRQMAGRGVTR